MDEIKKSILAVLPDIDPALLQEIIHHLIDEVGVNEPADFKYIQYEDLPMLKPIQRRRYLDSLKKKGRLITYNIQYIIQSFGIEWGLLH